MKDVFSYNSDIDKTAFLNWRTKKHEHIHNMFVIADGYMQAAVELAQTCLADNFHKKADAIIFPILFCANHGIELYEKSICWSLNILLGYKKHYPDNHKIRENWYTVKGKIKEFGFDEAEGRGKNEFYSMINVLENYLDELYSKLMRNGNKDTAFHNIDFSRYPLNNREDPQFYIDEIDNVAIDLENFAEVINNIHECLYCLATYYYEQALNKLEQNY